MKTRTAVRSGIVASGLAIAAVASISPALATTDKQPGQHYPSLGLLNTILLFVVLPLGIFAVVSGLAVLPSAIAQRRYAKAAPWDYSPVWIGGPANPRGVMAAHAANLAAAQELEAERLASAANAAATVDAPADDADATVPAADSSAELVDAGVRTARGGASAEW